MPLRKTDRDPCTSAFAAAQPAVPIHGLAQRHIRSNSTEQFAAAKALVGALARFRFLDWFGAALREQYAGDRGRHRVNFTLPEAAHFLAPHPNPDALFKANHHWSNLQPDLEQLAGQAERTNIQADLEAHQVASCRQPGRSSDCSGIN
jgi:hypothetical protein